MNERELYRQKMEAQLDEWKADLDKLKARASGADADARLKLKGKVREIEAELEKGKSKLRKLSQAGEDSWDSVKEDLSSSWDSLKSAFGEVSHFFDEKDE